MKRFSKNKNWTADDAKRMINVMKQAAKDITERKGFIWTNVFNEGYAKELGFNSHFWTGVGTDMNQDNRSAKKGKSKFYTPGQNGVTDYLSIISAFFYGLKEEKNKNYWSVGQADPTDDECLAVAGQMNAVKEKGMTNSISYSDMIEFINFMDLNSVTVRAIESAKASTKLSNAIDNAISLIEASCRESHYNSNISGKMYEKLWDVKNDIKELKIENDRVKINELGRDLDALNVYATKYLDYKADEGYKPTAYGKIQAALQIKNIMDFCYGGEKIKKLKAPTQEDIDVYMTGRKKHREGKGKVNVKFSDSRKHIFATEQTRSDIKKMEACHDNSLKHCVEAHKPKVAVNVPAAV